MRKYNRKQEQNNFSCELAESWEYLCEMKWLELRCCTEYQIAYNIWLDHPHWPDINERLELWHNGRRGVAFILRGPEKEDLSCLCFDDYFQILVKFFPSFEQEIWMF